jgi:hypothetical protein
VLYHTKLAVKKTWAQNVVGLIVHSEQRARSKMQVSEKKWKDEFGR